MAMLGENDGVKMKFFFLNHVGVEIIPKWPYFRLVNYNLPRYFGYFWLSPKISKW